jgi:hypothetical protein
MDRVSKKELEAIIDKPRAFRNAFIAENVPVRRAMIFLGSESPNAYEIPRHYKRIVESRKIKNNEPIF